jgi:hypothetical protein
MVSTNNINNGINEPQYPWASIIIINKLGTLLKVLIYVVGISM